MRYLAAICALMCVAYDAHADPDDVSGFGMRVHATQVRKCEQKTKDKDEVTVTCKTVVTTIKVAAVACNGPANRAGVQAGDFIDSIGRLDVEDGVAPDDYQKFLKLAMEQPTLTFRFRRESREIPFRYETKRLDSDTTFVSKNFSCGDGSI